MVSSLVYITDCLSMTLVIIGIIFNMFLFFINTYGSYLKSIHHSYFYTHRFSPVAHTFPSLAPYPHGDTKYLVLSVPYDNFYDISKYFQPHIIYGTFLHHIRRNICDSDHNFAAMQGTDYINDCLNFCTLWEGVCTYIFSISFFFI